MSKYLAFISLIVVFFCQIAGAEILSVDAAVKNALSSNPEITAAKSSLDSAKAKVPRTISLQDPWIGLEYEQIPSGSRNLEDGMKMYTAQQMVMFPGKIYADYLTAANEASMFDWRYRAKILEISSAVKASYYDLFYADRSVETLKEVKGLLEQMKKSAISRYTTGAVPQTDALMANIEYMVMSNELQTMQQERKAKESGLKSLLNQTDAASIETSAALTLPGDIEKEDDFRNAALAQRPELLEMKAQIDVKDAQSFRSKMEFFPDLDLKAKKRVSDGWDAMFALSVPLYFWKQGYGVSSSGSEKSALEAAYSNMKNMTISEVKDASVMANTALVTMKLYKKEIIPQSLSAFNVSLSAYKGGKIDFQTILQIEKTYKEAKLKMYESQIKYGKAVAKLERLTGKEIK